VAGVSRDFLWQLVTWAGRMFAGGVLLALPVVTALLVINLAFGVMTRAAPQLNIFAVGFPVSLFMGFVFLFLSLPGVGPHVSGLLVDAFAFIRHLTGG
jgi:flagellar biosynthetic protein FliR